MRMKRVHSKARVPLRQRAPFSRTMGNRRVWTSIPPRCHQCHRCLPRDDSPWRQRCPFQRGVPYKPMRLPGFGLKMWLLIKKRSAVRPIYLSRSCSYIGVPSDGDLGLGIWYLDHAEECDRKNASRRPRRSDRGADDQRPICENGLR